jgi:hypothetical protein
LRKRKGREGDKGSRIFYEGLGKVDFRLVTTAYSSIPQKVLYMNLETTRLRGRPRNRWQDEVRKED